MMNTRILIGAAALAVAACDSGTDPTDLARVDQVIVSPEDTTVEHPDSFRYRVQLLDADSAVIDDGVNRPMTFTPSDHSVINVTATGFVRTEEEGVTTVSVHVGGSTGHASLIVTDNAANTAPEAHRGDPPN